jgi:hypothetical protein
MFIKAAFIRHHRPSLKVKTGFEQRRKPSTAYELLSHMEQNFVRDGAAHPFPTRSLGFRRWDPTNLNADPISPDADLPPSSGLCSRPILLSTEPFLPKASLEGF